MIRGLIRFVLILVLIVGVAAFFFGYSWGDLDVGVGDRPVGTAGVDRDGDVGDVDVGAARETGAEVGERVAVGADRAQQAIADASLTTKIKAKMALDDDILARSIDVDTDGTVVTLTGRVSSEAERARAVQMARETDGVTSVVDRLTVASPGN